MTHLYTSDPFTQAAAARFPVLMLTEKDVAALLQVSPRLLQQMRSENKAPPDWVTIRGLVRYPADKLFQWANSVERAPADVVDPAASAAPIPMALPSVELAGLDEPILRSGRRRTRQASFQAFLTTALPKDAWLFVRPPGGRPIDFLATLEADERRDEDEVLWLRLDAYLHEVLTGAKRDAAALVGAHMGEQLPDAPPGGKPRRGPPA